MNELDEIARALGDAFGTSRYDCNRDEMFERVSSLLGVIATHALAGLNVKEISVTTADGWGVQTGTRTSKVIPFPARLPWED